MKAWLALPAAALALAAGLFAAPSSVVSSHQSVETAGLVVRVAVAEPVVATVMTDACVFSAEAMAAGAPVQCGTPVMVHAVSYRSHGETQKDAPLQWPGDFFALTANAALQAWDATIGFITSLFGLADALDI